MLCLLILEVVRSLAIGVSPTIVLIADAVAIVASVVVVVNPVAGACVVGAVVVVVVVVALRCV